MVKTFQAPFAMKSASGFVLEIPYGNSEAEMLTMKNE
jgi:hypothetical protein